MEIMQQRCRKDLTGQRFGRLTVLEMIWRVNKTTLCRCLCDCGAETIVRNADLLSGHTQSCGCLQREAITESNTKDFTGLASEWGIQIIEPHQQNKRGVWLWKCKCGFCGNYFYELPAHIMDGSQKSCGCQGRSSGEALIHKYLTDNNIPFEPQYSFADCRDKHRLLFDFAVFDKHRRLRMLIEFDGQQHFKSIELFGGEAAFEVRQRHDQIKNEYCATNNIPLCRIPYTMTPEEIITLLTNIINP